VARPSAAADFAAIRARMEELRRERTPTPPPDKALQPPVGRQPYPAGTDKAGMSPVMHRMLQRART
jgi:hypothetical protein